MARDRDREQLYVYDLIQCLPKNICEDGILHGCINKLAYCINRE